MHLLTYAKTIIKYATAVNSPDMKAISIAAYERGFVVLYEETRSSLREQSLREDINTKIEDYAWFSDLHVGKRDMDTAISSQFT